MQKLKPIATWSPAFSRALGSLFVFTWVFIGSERNFPFLWLAVVVPLVMVFRRSTEKCSTYSSLVPCCIFKLRNILWRLFKTTSIPFWIFQQANIPRKSSLITISILCRFALCFPFPPFVSLQKFRSTMVHQGKSEFNLLIFSYLQMSHYRGFFYFPEFVPRTLASWSDCGFMRSTGCSTIDWLTLRTGNASLR